MDAAADRTSTCSADSDDTEPTIRGAVARWFSGIVFAAFLGYYGLLCFRHQGWGGDFQMYCAGISQLYRNFLEPLHEAMDAPGSQSTTYTFYLVVLAAFGKVFGATPYRVLEVAGAFNLLAYCLGAAYLYSRFSLHRRWWLPAACFVYASTCVRWLHFGWSSELSLTNLQYIQSYPSTLAWALAFFSFGLAHDVQQHRRVRDVAILAAVLAVALLTHVLTASWMIGIVGLHASWSAARRRDIRLLVRPGLAVAAAVALASLWPYSPFFGQSSMSNVPEGSPFGASPLRDFPTAYALALPCIVYLIVRFRRHAFWVLAFLATLGALALWRHRGFTFGNRYSFFAAFCAHFVIAEVMALGVLALVGRLREPPRARLAAWLDRPLAIAVLALALVSWVPSPMGERAARATDYGKLLSPFELLRLESPLEAYYREVEELVPFIGPSDRVITPVTRAVFDFATVTGARMVSSPNAWLVPERVPRQRDMNLFFSRGAKPRDRDAIVRRRHATRVLLPRSHFVYLGGLLQQLGEPLYRSDRYVVWAVKPAGAG